MLAAWLTLLCTIGAPEAPEAPAAVVIVPPAPRTPPEAESPPDSEPASEPAPESAPESIGDDQTGPSDSERVAPESEPAPTNSSAGGGILGEDDDEEPFASELVAEDGAKKKKKKVKAKVGGRVIAGMLMRERAAPVDLDGAVIGEPRRTAELELRQARLKVDVRYLEILRVRISADFADLLGSPEAGEVIRDAWGNVRVHSAFQIKVGNFKRPYSRLELRGVSKIPVIGRGLFNSAMIETLGWGDRAVGVGLWGELEPKRAGLHALGWAVTASNNAIAGAPHGVDVHARVTYDPTSWFSLGVSGAYKHVQDSLADETACLDDWRREPDCRRDVFGAGVDVLVRVKDLYASVEANFAQDWLFADESPWGVGALAYATYDFKIAKRTSLQPVVFGEYVDTNLSIAQSEAVRAVAGVNVLWTKYLRVMPQAQFVVPLAPVTAFNQFTRSWIVGLWVSVQL